MLNLINVTKRFSEGKPALQEINLSLAPGEFCIIIGSNGSGKSTLMRCISGQYIIDSGKIEIDKKSLISSVSQDINKGTIPEMTLLENVVLSKLPGKKASFNFYKSHENQVISLVKELNLGLESYINRPLSQLSGGQRQMIATLMAITSKPSILLLDEHTSALDPKMQNILMDYTAKNIAQHKITSLMITHKLDDAIKYGNRLIMLHMGKIVLDINKEDKAKLDVNSLLNLFHQYENLTLRGKP
jgi:putative ABC transport system ATP-binding protein